LLFHFARYSLKRPENIPEREFINRHGRKDIAKKNTLLSLAFFAV
jgi:hypothetical protein